jgi:hypothetical protein
LNCLVKITVVALRLISLLFSLFRYDIDSKSRDLSEHVSVKIYVILPVMSLSSAPMRFVWLQLWLENVLLTIIAADYRKRRLESGNKRNELIL